MDSECTPLIDPWYDTHSHFPKMPGEYLPPPLSHVWLSLCRHNTEISWAPLASLILDLIIRQGTSLPVPILFKFGSGTALGWKEWVDTELSNKGFMSALQQSGLLKAIVSSHCLSNYRDLFNLCHLVRQWCIATHTFFLSYDEITVTLEDLANQLLLPILGDVDLAALELSTKEEALEAELRKGMSGNAKLFHWVRAFSKAFVSAYRAGSSHSGFVIHLWFSSSLYCEAFVFPISYQDIYWGESAIGPYVSGSSVCAIRHFAK